MTFTEHLLQRKQPLLNGQLGLTVFAFEFARVMIFIFAAYGFISLFVSLGPIEFFTPGQDYVLFLFWATYLPLVWSCLTSLSSGYCKCFLYDGLLYFWVHIKIYQECFVFRMFFKIVFWTWSQDSDTGSLQWSQVCGF